MYNTLPVGSVWDSLRPVLYNCIDKATNSFRIFHKVGPGQIEIIVVYSKNINIARGELGYATASNKKENIVPTNSKICQRSYTQ